jgi:hydrogenase nickel incorporation protein HypA/HybF
MHELSITQGIIDIVLQHAERGGAKRVNAIHLVIGELTGLVDDSIQFYFDMLSPDTIASGAKLVIQRIPARLRCRKCGCEFELADMQWVCPQCSAVGGEPLAGQEFLVESIEVE